MSDTLYKWVNGKDELPDLKFLIRDINTKKIVNSNITGIEGGNIYFNYGGIFSIEYYEWLKPVSEEGLLEKKTFALDLEIADLKDENKNLKNQIRSIVAGAVMNEQSLLELNRSIADNVIDKAIKWCDEKLLEVKKDISQGWRGEDLKLLIQRRTDLDFFKQKLISLSTKKEGVK